MRLTSDLISAFMLLSRLPVGQVTGVAPTAVSARAAWAWPVVGAVLGALAAGVGLAVATLGLPIPFAAAMALVTLVMVSGAMHEDGLADVADGFWGGFTRDRRLEIMRDSRIGAYGVIALVLSLVMRWALLVQALEIGNLVSVAIVAGVVSRAPMAVVMAWLPQAREDGLSQSSGTPPRRAVTFAISIAAMALLSQGIAMALLAGSAAAAAALGVALLARRKIGGQTGDVLGTVQQVCEICLYAALVSR